MSLSQRVDSCWFRALLRPKTGLVIEARIPSDRQISTLCGQFLAWQVFVLTSAKLATVLSHGSDASESLSWPSLGVVSACENLCIRANSPVCAAMYIEYANEPLGPALQELIAGCFQNQLSASGFGSGRL